MPVGCTGQGLRFKLMGAEEFDYSFHGKGLGTLCVDI